MRKFNIHRCSWRKRDTCSTLTPSARRNTTRTRWSRTRQWPRYVSTRLKPTRDCSRSTSLRKTSSSPSRWPARRCSRGSRPWTSPSWCLTFLRKTFRSSANSSTSSTIKLSSFTGFYKAKSNSSRKIWPKSKPPQLAIYQTPPTPIKGSARSSSSANTKSSASMSTSSSLVASICSQPGFPPKPSKLSVFHTSLWCIFKTPFLASMKISTFISRGPVPCITILWRRITKWWNTRKILEYSLPKRRQRKTKKRKKTHPPSSGGAWPKTPSATKSTNSNCPNSTPPTLSNPPKASRCSTLPTTVSQKFSNSDARSSSSKSTKWLRLKKESTRRMKTARTVRSR